MTKKQAAKKTNKKSAPKPAAKSAGAAKKPAAKKPAASGQKASAKKKPAAKPASGAKQAVFKASLKSAPAKKPAGSAAKKPSPQTPLKSAPKTKPAKAANGAKKGGKISIKISPRPAGRAAKIPEDQEVSKPQKKTRARASDSIVFTLEDLDAYLEMRASGSGQQQAKAVSKSAVGKAAPAKGPAAPAPFKATSSPKNPVAAASIFDILGFNPVETPSLEKHREKEIPRKWKKYYNMLVDLRKRHSRGAESISEEVLKRSAKEDSGDLSSYGQHLADAGSESFERDMAYNLLSNEKEMIAEIDAAIERIRNGTYGVCEVTGEPIPESRLEAIPFTRCTKEGQEIKEAENKKIKSVQRSIYDIDASGSPEDEDMPS